ncbi:MAG: 3-oxoacyl-ACP synthase III [Desulfobacterales bacterium]|nr:3-oxoacyl-ACP synthase III [Desulfobacterales bacterium]
MRFTKVSIAGLGYELATNVITSDDLEKRLAPVYNTLHIQPGQLEALTGISERRFWDADVRLSEKAAQAGKKALKAARIDPREIGALIYGGVCRENLEPATACAVAHELGISPAAHIFDLSNACLGVLNGMVHIASAIELGQISAGMVVSCESARPIVEMTLQRLLDHPSMALYKDSLATFTGGSGAVAVVLCDASRSSGGHKLIGGVTRNATQHHALCTWGSESGLPYGANQIMKTDAVGVLKHGVSLGIETFREFRKELGWPEAFPEKVICHQVGSAHQRTILEAFGIESSRDFGTFRYLGNIGTVSLPITAAIADERQFLKPGDRVGFLGIGSGLNCLMLGMVW